jgi:hypothetical protein
VLEVSDLVPGQPFTITVSGGTTGQTVYLGWGTTLGPGTCPPILDGICLDIVSPSLLTTLTIAPGGSASFSGTLPLTFAASGVALQAAIGAGTSSLKSNAVFTEIGNPNPGTACNTWSVTGARANPESIFVPFRPGNPATAWAVESLNMRQVTLSGTSNVSLSAQGITAWTTAGAAVSLPSTITTAQMPYTFLVHGDEFGPGAIVATPTTAGCATAELEVEVGRVELAGQAISGSPWFQVNRGFWNDEDVELGIDPKRHDDRVGQSYTAYVVEHKTDAQWAADQTLTPITPTITRTVQPGFTVDNIEMLLTSALTIPRLERQFDIVLDFDGNGVRSRGDLVHGDDKHPAFTVVADPTAAGPYGTRQADWNAGGTWGEQRIYAPTTLTPENMPLVVISHGNGHDYRYYDYLGQHFASWGYAVMSHESNTGPGPASAATTLIANTEDYLQSLSSHFGGALVGRLDGTISWIGHSRGGEAVALAYDDLVEGSASSPAFSATNITTIHSIAPTVFLGASQADPKSKTYHLIAGGADGDVTGGVDCAVCQYYRIPGYATGRTMVTFVHGASHNDFHGGGGWQDATGPTLIGGAEARKIAKAKFLGILEWHHRGRTVFEEMFTRGTDGWRPTAFLASDLVANTFIPGTTEGAWWLDDFQVNTATNLSSSGGAVTFAVSNVSENTLNDTNSQLSWSTSDPMNGMSQVESDGNERGVVFDWTGHAWMEWEVPAAGRDQSGRDFLQMRLAQGTRHPNTELLDTGLSVGITLRDGAGQTVTIRPGFTQTVEDPYERTGLGTGAGWSNEFDTVSVRLSDFLRDGTGLDLSDIRAVRIETGPFYGSTQGRVGVDDIVFVREGFR